MALGNESVVISFKDGSRSGHGSNLFIDENYLYSYGYHFIVAIRRENDFILNGDTYSNSTSKHQDLARHYLNPQVIIPFSVLNQIINNIRNDIGKLKIIEKTSDTIRESVRKNNKTGELETIQEHQLGSVLFRYDKKSYLSSTDAYAKEFRRGYFLVQLPCQCNTMKEAYESLIPLEIKKNNWTYKRQGEFFFVEVDKEEVRTAKTRMHTSGRQEFDLATVFSKDEINRGNKHTAKEIRQKGNKIYAIGQVKHPEHKSVMLKTWHRVYKNRAIRSFAARGNID